MTSTADTTQHPDVSEISDLTEGVLSPPRTADVRRHVDSCELCSDVQASLEEIRSLLGSMPAPQTMPIDIADRIDAALADEARAVSTASDVETDVSRETEHAATVQDLADRPAGHSRAATGPGRAVGAATPPHGGARHRTGRRRGRCERLPAAERLLVPELRRPQCLRPRSRRLEGKLTNVLALHARRACP